MFTRRLLPLLVAVALIRVVDAQTFQRHAPYLLPAYVTALGFDPTAERLTALMRSPVGWPSGEMFQRVGTRWNAGPDTVPAITCLVPDMQRRRLVGLEQSFGTLRTWEWDGATWTLRGTVQLSQVLGVLLACWHEGLGRVVLLDPHARTLAWDGSQWQQLAGRPATPLSADGELVYDRARNVCVWYSGADLWEFDGVAWQRRTFAVQPSRRLDIGFVYDPLRQRCVLFGGYISADLQETWEYDGTAWFQMAPVHVPPARMRHAMAFDPVRQRTVLLGGSGYNTMSLFGYWHDDEWEWDGQDWLRVQQDHRPPFADPVGMAEDPVGGGVLMTTSKWTPSGTRMWRWTGGDWFPLAPNAVTPGAVGAMCSDPFRAAIWCFDSGLVSKTWRFDGAAWQQLSPPVQPQPRIDAAIAFDRARNLVVLFGGGTYSTDFDDTWTWDGNTWTEQSPAHRPPGRFGHTMAFDPISSRVLMTGGVHSGLWQTTWAWNGSDWADLGGQVSVSYPPRMIEHHGRNTVVLLSGYGTTQEWNGSAWTGGSAMPAHLNASHYLYGAPFRDKLVVFDRANTWIASPSGAQVASYGSGCGAATPRLDAAGAPTPGTTDFDLFVDRAEPSGLAFLFEALAPDSVAFGSCTLLLQAPVTIGLMPLSPSGAAAFPHSVPDAAWLLGLDVYWQAITFGSMGVAFSPGLRTRLGY